MSTAQEIRDRIAAAGGNTGFTPSWLRDTVNGTANVSAPTARDPRLDALDQQMAIRGGREEQRLQNLAQTTSAMPSGYRGVRRFNPAAPQPRRPDPRLAALGLPDPNSVGIAALGQDQSNLAPPPAPSTQPNYSRGDLRRMGRAIGGTMPQGPLSSWTPPPDQPAQDAASGYVDRSTSVYNPTLWGQNHLASYKDMIGGNLGSGNPLPTSPTIDQSMSAPGENPAFNGNSAGFNQTQPAPQLGAGSPAAGGKGGQANGGYTTQQGGIGGLSNLGGYMGNGGATGGQGKGG